MSQVTATQPQHDDALHDAPALHYELEPRLGAFWCNLTDLILRREPAPLETTSQPVPVPEDTFIRTGLGARHYLESYGYHALLIVLIYFFSTSSFFNHPVQLQSPFKNTAVEHYALSEYLPPINTGQKGAAKPRKGEPKLAKQEILSVPPNPDNYRQTIVTPPQVKLNKDVPLPNVVAWTPVPAAQPIAASSPKVSQLKIPQFQQQVVEPSADVSGLKPKLLVPPELRPKAVEPAADLSALKTSPKLAVPQQSAVEPSISADALKLKTGQLNIAQMQPQVEAPKLPVSAQH